MPLDTNRWALIIMLVAVLLTVTFGCNSEFTKTADNDRVTIYWPKENRSVQSVMENCKPNSTACVMYSNNDFTDLIMYAPAPLDDEDHESIYTLGHELLHGYYGSYH